jgi:hypothetical protein
VASVRPYRASEGTIRERAGFLPYHSGRDTDDQVTRERFSRSEKSFHNLAFPGREPETDARKKIRDFDDSLKVGNALQIPAIMPAENSFIAGLPAVLLFQQGNHCPLPSEHIRLQNLQATGLGILYRRKDIHTTQSVAGMANTSDLFGQDCT